MGWMIPAAIAAGSIGSSLLGNRSARKASEAAMAEAQRVREQALAELSGLDPIQLSALGYSPEEISYIQAPQPLLYDLPADVDPNLVAVDDQTRDIQMQALQDLLDRSEEGLSAQDQYNFMRNRRRAETAARGAEQAIINNLRQRGMSGTGLEAALRMMSSQGASERLAEQEALQAAENANMRLSALQAQAGLAGDIRGQDIGMAQSNADILNQFAWQNSERARQINNMNINLKNQAAQRNIDEQRRINAANVDMRNQADLLNRQRDIENQRIKQQSEHDIARSKAGAMTGGIPDIYAQGAADAAGQRQMWNTIGSGLGTVGQMYMSSQAADQQAAERQKDREMMMNMYGRNNAGYTPLTPSAGYYA